ncbi:MAG: penicillin-insensitive murein endopeptidase [Kofleriaceae bacterium]
MRVFLVLLVVARTAAADHHILQSGETLEHVARGHGCTVAELKRANGVSTTLLRAGTVVVIPACGSRPVATKPAPTSDDDRARRALEVIDGTKLVERPQVREPDPVPVQPDGPSQSIGTPWNGKLRNGKPMPRGEGYSLRRPQRAYGAAHVVDHLRRVIAEVRALHPDVHTLAIGDLSARSGGQLDRHVSHQSGLDVDVGLYYRKVPADYPAQFVDAGVANLDLESTWALLVGFARTSRLASGVQVILLDYDIQARLYRWALARGTPEDQLGELLQYPRGKDAGGIVRHWPHHADHMHVRFKPD